MNIKVSSININRTKVWLIIQTLYFFQKGKSELLEVSGFLCYYKFSDPFKFLDGELINWSEGELIMGNKQKPKIFLTDTEIELFASEYIRRRMLAI